MPLPGSSITAYILQVRNLLHDPNAQIYSDAILSGFIDEARLQVAIEGECLRAVAGFTTTGNQSSYHNSDITSPPGLGKVLKIQAIRHLGAIIYSGNISGDKLLQPRPWEWFQFYWLTLGPHAPGLPQAWAPYQHGFDGTFYIGPTPFGAYSLGLDCVFVPTDLTGTGSSDTIPYPWTEAVQYLAAYYALLDGQRYADADHMLELYELFMQRARGGVTSSQVPTISPGGQSSRGRGAAGQVPLQTPTSPASPTSGRPGG